jgi:hypothetical protein
MSLEPGTVIVIPQNLSQWLALTGQLAMVATLWWVGFVSRVRIGAGTEYFD